MAIKGVTDHLGQYASINDNLAADRLIIKGTFNHRDNSEEDHRGLRKTA